MSNKNAAACLAAFFIRTSRVGYISIDRLPLLPQILCIVLLVKTICVRRPAKSPTVIRATAFILRVTNA
jgi:hypothetical protein